MIHDFDLEVKKKLSATIFTIIKRHASWKQTPRNIAKKKIAWMDLILDTQSAEYTWQAFYMFNDFG